jgi:hypothetical protein
MVPSGTISSTPPSPSSEREICPESKDPNFQNYVGFSWPQALYSPPGFRQQSKGASAYPFLSTDIWAEVADKKRVFFIRPFDFEPNMTQLQEWIEIQPHPVTVIMSNNHDFSSPKNEEDKETWNDFVSYDNLKALYTMNPRSWDEHPKIKPLPIGLKWQDKSGYLYGEDKSERHDIYSSVSTSPSATQKLFKKDRLDSVWVRPLTNRAAHKYDSTANAALSIRRNKIQPLLEQIAPKTLVKASKEKLSQVDYFAELQRHRFVVSPVGVGLDSHATWEALLAGTIPIVPHSPLDPLFEDLPVWLIDSWEEVTDEAVLRKSQEMRSRTYNWEKVFVDGWKKEVYGDLCNLPSDHDGKPHTGVVGGNSWDTYTYGPDLADGQWPRSSFGVVKTPEDESVVAESIKNFIRAQSEQ